MGFMVRNCFLLVFAFHYILLSETIINPSMAQAINFGDSSNVDNILKQSFGGEVSTRTSRPPSANCRTPNQLQGQCVMMSQCPVYIPLVRRIRDPGIFAFIRERICSLEVTSVRICCPNDPQNVILPTSSRLPSGGFVQQNPSTQTPQPVRINFGGSSSGSNSQSLPLLPQQSRPISNLPSQPPEKTSTTTPIQTQNPFIQGTADRIPVSLPILPPLVPSSQSPLSSTQAPQNGVSFSPNALIPDRMNEEQSQDLLNDPTFVRPPGQCGFFDNLQTARSLGQSPAPWLAAIGFFNEGGNFEINCGGALITPKHVITAAHCLNVLSKPTHVRLGDYDLGRSTDLAKPQDISIADFKTPGFNSNTFANDIAILTLANDIIFDDFIQPLCLPYRFQFDGFRYQSLNVTGWSHTQLIKGRDNLPQIANDFTVPVIRLGDCRRRYQRASQSVIINRSNLCAMGGNQNECLADSSALAIFHDDTATNRVYLAGLGSFGFGCNQPGSPYVFTRIGHHLPWIENVISSEDR